MWGLGRVIALEHPEWWGGLIDLDPNRHALDVEKVWREIDFTDGEDQIAYRCDQRVVARLTRIRAMKSEAIHFDANASYLISGGLGGLGLNVAAWMADNGARHLTLLSRSSLPARGTWHSLPAGSDVRRRVDGIQALEARDVQVNVCSGDVGNLEEMASLFARFGNELPQLKGIVHAAAALSNWPIADLPLDALTRQFGAKVRGAIILDQLASDIDLDFFVTFSSTTAIWGVRELGHYASANAFLDAFAYCQRARGVAAFSINWGTWESMRVASNEERASVAEYGLKPMPSDQALAILGSILVGNATTQMVVAAVDWSLLKPTYEARRQRPLLEYMNVTPVQESNPASIPQVPLLLAQLERVAVEERLSVVMSHISELAASVLGEARAERLDVHQGLFEMGMDSLMSVELKSRLERTVGKSLPSTLTFNYPTIADLADYMVGSVLVEAVSVQLAVETPTVAVVSDTVSAVDVIEGDEELDDFSEDELAELLLKKLKGLQ